MNGTGSGKFLRKVKHNRNAILFITIGLAFPLVQFILFYICVNANSLILAFKEYQGDNSYTFAGLDNFKRVIQTFLSDPMKLTLLKNSLVMCLFSVAMIFVNIIVTYLLWRKAWGSGFFKVILFMPSIISTIVFVVCAVTVTSENYQALPDISAEVVQGEKVTWTKDANAVEYRVSEDGGSTWQTLATNEYAIAESDTPRSYDILLVAVGDGINYGDSNALKLTLRTKLHFMVNGDNEIDFVGNGSDSYALYSGDTLLKDNIESGTALNSVLTSGDYSLKIVAKKGTEEKSSNVIDLQTGPINPYEINSFDSKKSEAEMGDSGYSLKLECNAEYNSYYLRSLNALTGVTKFSFYIYIDSTQFKNIDGTAASPSVLYNNGFIRSLNASNTFTPEKPLVFNEWIRVDAVITDTSGFEKGILLQAANNPVEWGGEYVEGAKAYSYVFYIDDVYMEA